MNAILLAILLYSINSVCLGYNDSTPAVQLEDLPNELLLKILESSTRPSWLSSVNRRFSKLPIPCHHHPHLLIAALHTYHDAHNDSSLSPAHDPIVQKCIHAIKERQQPLHCFGENSLQLALQYNATEIVSALWEQRNHWGRKADEEDKALMAWIGNRGAFFSLLYSFQEIIEYLFTNKFFSSTYARVSNRDVLQWKDSDPKFKQWQEPTLGYGNSGDQSSLYYNAVIFSNSIKMLEFLIKENVPFTPECLAYACHMGRLPMVETLWKKFGDQLSLLEINLNLMTAVQRNHTETVLFIVQQVDFLTRVRVIDYVIDETGGIRLLELFQGLDMQEKEDMLIVIAECLAVRPDRFIHKVTWTKLLFSEEYEGWSPNCIEKLLERLLSFNEEDNSTRVWLANNLVEYFSINEEVLNRLTTLDTELLLEFWNDVEPVASELRRWLGRIQWLRKQCPRCPKSLNISKIISRTLRFSILQLAFSDEKDLKLWDKDKLFINNFYMTILTTLNVSKNDLEPLRIAVVEKKNWTVVKKLLDYGIKPDTAFLQDLKQKNVQLYETFCKIYLHN